ncbi:Short-chain dehydrogenase/reductase ABA4 like protein [Verticillium longisporum]|uniref:Short-chain dehydrogenase/reductase ABA4 like protein n=1 Tax=Verticillium longisporum TaxID=100787 RepID=A0A8I2Z018_VERLO|nr:Short-chain dehydrogenase/reductase ABA4 like protein [Verticillium longisporum]
MSLAGKVYAVTGGASGIGLATAKQISARGGTVCIADVDANALAHAEAFFAAQTPAASFAITKVDVSKRDQVEAWIGGVVARFGRLDGAANIAGVIGKDHGVKPVAELDDDEWHKIIGVNLTGLITTGMANHGAYAASKHGVLGLTRAAAKENGAREAGGRAVQRAVGHPEAGHG